MTLRGLLPLLGVTAAARADPADPADAEGGVPAPVQPEAPSVGELAGFWVQQEAALSICEARKDAAVAVMEAYNRAASTPHGRASRWWRPWS